MSSANKTLKNFEHWAVYYIIPIYIQLFRIPGVVFAVFKELGKIDSLIDLVIDKAAKSGGAKS